MPVTTKNKWWDDYNNDQDDNGYAADANSQHDVQDHGIMMMMGAMMMERADHSTNEGLSDAHDEDCDDDDDDDDAESDGEDSGADDDDTDNYDDADDIGDNVGATHDVDDDDGINAESDTMRW